MQPPFPPSRRDLFLAWAAGLTCAAVTGEARAEQPSRVFQIGVISATIRGKSQARNGFEVDFGRQREPRHDSNVLPFPNTKITHYYDKDPEEAKRYAEAFPGVQPAAAVRAHFRRLEEIRLAEGLDEPKILDRLRRMRAGENV